MTEQQADACVFVFIERSSSEFLDEKDGVDRGG
jgi:hypothetical protein